MKKNTTHPEPDVLDSSASLDGIDRRGFLKCMAWAGTGVVWSFAGGVPISRAFGLPMRGSRQEDFSFVQISDSHIGFNKPANTDVTGTLQAAVDKILSAPGSPDFLIHTGDLTHTSKPSEFDTMDQVLTGARRQIFYVPGEHDTAVDDGKLYLERYGKDAAGNGWYSFDHKGVHFVGLVNVVQLEGMGRLGQAQLDWLKKDLASRKSSTPIVLFAHIPLWAVYPDWGWSTSDSEQAFSLLKRFGSITVLNGHIHQVMQKVEGNATFHTAMSTAFPQPAPGSAPSPGPVKVSAEKLRGVLGIAEVHFVAQRHSLAVVDSTLTARAEKQTSSGAEMSNR
ncbi:metallophosphoesterase [Alloacidobacterium sp.]|uniref:metallophosphoesterase family protein n=1 Tax=Alloacidobacterium sp. TaxID=2951999 RepID=UPI002D417C17|nr:metallophosphoesterase [Alloacidobacterium sp.]HYK35530.1 metallophosphoesterase [Alloacidobacterium sp.]